MKSVKLAMIMTAGVLMTVQSVNAHAAEKADFVVVNEEVGVPVFPYTATILTRLKYSQEISLAA
jgi:hypothetical protein